jgi:capsular polysaccharide biosynthesis protein
VTGADADQVKKIANGIGSVLQTQAPKYIAQLRLGNADIQVVDPPDFSVQTTGLRGNLDVVVRAALGFAAGLAIALLLHYLDTSIHNGGEAEKLLGVPVLGEIPVEKKKRGFGSAPSEA